MEPLRLTREVVCMKEANLQSDLLDFRKIPNRVVGALFSVNGTGSTREAELCVCTKDIKGYPLDTRDLL